MPIHQIANVQRTRCRARRPSQGSGSSKHCIGALARRLPRSPGRGAACPVRSATMAKSWLGRMKEVGNLRGPLDWLRIAADGNLWVTIFEKGPTGKLVGEDYHGNRYYEDTATTYNRKRWVVYKDMTNYNPSEIPAEWHGWLNYINDFDPASHKFKQPIYAIEATVTKTGTPAAYGPKGSWGSTDKRNWLKYEAWAPGQQK